jgi:hypothetical protein
MTVFIVARAYDPPRASAKHHVTMPRAAPKMIQAARSTFPLGLKERTEPKLSIEVVSLGRPAYVE